MNLLTNVKTIDYQKSNIILGASFSSFQDFIPKKKRNRTIIITDNNLNRIYGESFNSLPIIEIPAGEESKSMNTIMNIVEQLLDLGADRHSFLLGIGGGVICDITGFVASVFMRGISFAYVSTSLLSQVDASIGGKTGINFNTYKNIIGTFNHPEFVICDLKMLSTLPDSEYVNGLGEVIKHALIADNDMYEYLKKNRKQILKRNNSYIKHLIERSIQIKTNIVNADERESGVRKKLNFGHTLGHAVEANSNLNHGEAISVGMVLAAKLSYQLGYCDASVVENIESLLTNFGLPTSTNIPSNILLEAIQKDKKKADKAIDFVFIKNPGSVMIEKILPEDIINLNDYP